MNLNDVRTMVVLREQYTKFLNDNPIFEENINSFIVFLLSQKMIDENRITQIIIGGENND